MWVVVQGLCAWLPAAALLTCVATVLIIAATAASHNMSRCRCQQALYRHAAHMHASAKAQQIPRCMLSNSPPPYPSCRDIIAPHKTVRHGSRGDSIDGRTKHDWAAGCRRSCRANLLMPLIQPPTCHGVGCVGSRTTSCFNKGGKVLQP